MRSNSLKIGTKGPSPLLVGAAAGAAPVDVEAYRRHWPRADTSFVLKAVVRSLGRQRLQPRANIVASFDQSTSVWLDSNAQTGNNSPNFFFYIFARIMAVKFEKKKAIVDEILDALCSKLPHQFKLRHWTAKYPPKFCRPLSSSSIHFQHQLSSVPIPNASTSLR